MRPEQLRDRPFFRPEAEKYRQLRHLGDIALFRPLGLRLVTLYPLVVVALLVFALSRLEHRMMFVAMAEAAPAQGEGLRLTLEERAARQLKRGDTLELRLGGSQERTSGSITELSTVPCSRTAQAFLLSSSRTAPRDCLQLTLAPPASGARVPSTLPTRVEGSGRRRRGISRTSSASDPPPRLPP